MIRASAAFLVSVMFASCSGDPNDTPGKAAISGSMQGSKIVFYNVENLFDTKNDPNKDDEFFLPGSVAEWTDERYQLKLERLAEAIAMAGDGIPVLVGLAEVENRQVLEDLVAQKDLGPGSLGIVHYDSPDERGIDVALLFRTDLVRIVHSEALPVSLQGGDRTRDVLYATVVDGADDLLHVFVCHWPSRGAGVKETEPKRMAAAHVVRNRVNSILENDPEAKVLIMGDLNDHPDDASVSEVLKASCDRNDGNALLVDLTCEEHRKGHGSYNYRGEWGYIDHFIASKALLDGVGSQAGKAAACWRNELLFDHPRNGPSPDRTYGGNRYHGGYSDHLPIVLELR